MKISANLMEQGTKFSENYLEMGFRSSFLNAITISVVPTPLLSSTDHIPYGAVLEPLSAKLDRSSHCRINSRIFCGFLHLWYIGVLQV